MSKNYDLIATVDIDIQNPVQDEISFDNILIVGPLPKTASDYSLESVMAFNNLSDVEKAGWISSGPDADPVGVAARIAFKQKNTPAAIYIAPMQLTEAAIATGKAISDINDIASNIVGQNEDLAGCVLSLNTDTRILAVNLTGAVSGVKNTGVFDALKQLTDAGYSCSVNGTVISGITAFKSSPEYKKLATLEQGGEPIQMEVVFSNADGISVNYGVIVAYPEDDVPISETAASFNAVLLSDVSSEAEDAVETVKRAVDTSGWYVVCPAGVPESEYTAIAEYIETQEKMFFYTELHALDNADSSPTVTGGTYYRTKGIFAKETGSQPMEDVPTENLYANVAAAAMWLTYASGSETSAFKEVSLISPSKLSSKDVERLNDMSLDYLVAIGHKTVTMNGKVLGNEWADIIRFRDWLKNDMQSRVANLFLTTPRIPYNDAGIALVQNQMIASLKAGLDRGGIAEEEFDEDGNSIPSYTTSVPTAASIPAETKQSRKLYNCKFNARLTGAIHFAELSGSLTYEM